MMPKIENAVGAVAIMLLFNGLILYKISDSLARLADKFAPKEEKPPEPKKPLSNEEQEQYAREQSFFRRHGWTWFVDRAGSGSPADRVLALEIAVVLVIGIVGASIWVFNWLGW